MVTIRPAEFDAYVPPFDKAGFPQSLIESCQVTGHLIGGLESAQKTDHVSWLLRTRCGDPCHSAAKKRNEIAPPHFPITPSAPDVQLPARSMMLSVLLLDQACKT